MKFKEFFTEEFIKENGDTFTVHILSNVWYGPDEWDARMTLNEALKIIGNRSWVSREDNNIFYFRGKCPW